MLNSKMKRSMAWLMTAAVVMTAAPVSAEDFSSEIDAEVTAETAVNEENTPVEENTEDSFYSAEISADEENSSATEEVATEDSIAEDFGDAEGAFYDGEETSSESTDAEAFSSAEDMTTDELLSVFSTTSSDNAAPYSSVDKLENGTYTVTANVYVPGELNKVLVGTNAFLTNPKYPFGSGADKGKPTTAMYYNAELNVNDNDITVTLELKNPVFQAIQINDGSNVTVADKTYNDELSNSEIHTKYGKKIQTLTLKLKDFSGLYEFGDCKEFASILYTEGNSATEADAVWDVPLKLAVDFQGIGKQETPVVTNFLNSELQVALVTNKELPEGTTEDMREITADSEGEDGRIYQEFDTFFKENATKSNNKGFRAFYIGLKDSNGNPISNIEQYKPTFYTQSRGFFAGYSGQKGQAMARIENSKLTTNIVHGGVGDAVNDLASFETEDGAWDYTFSYETETFSGGYIFIYDKDAHIPFKYHVEDSNTGIAMDYYGVSDSGFDLSQEEEANDYYRIKTAKNKRGIGDSELEAQLKEKSGYQKLCYNTYQMGMYSLATDPSTDDILYLGTSNQKLEVELPTDGLTDFQIYEIVYDKSDTSYPSVEPVTDYTVIDGKATFYAVNGGLSFQRKEIAQKLYGAATDDENYYGESSEYNIQYYAVVSEGAVADKPSVSNTTFTYDGTEKSLIPENQYYTVSGDVSKILPGSYKVTVTLKDGYAWKDGTSDPIEFTWNIKALQVEKPVAVSDLIYNGKTQEGVKAGTGYNLAGTYTAKNVGTYKAKVLLAEGYEWSDGTTDLLTLTWDIKPIQIQKPAAVTGLIYNGNTQEGVKAGEGYTLSGTYNAANAGSYEAKLLLTEGYTWSDGTTEPLTLTWKIAPADQTVTAKISTKNYKVTSIKKKTASFTIGASGQGTLSYNVVKTPAKASKYISVNKNGKVTVKKGAKTGTYVVRVSAAGNENYSAAYKDVTININKLTQKVTAKVSSKTYKAASLKKKAASFSIGAKTKTSLSYKVVKTPSKASKYITVSKNGKVTLKKKAPKGTYQIRVTAKANGTYNTAVKVIKVVVK